MVKFYEEIPNFVIPWIQEQKIFWVATAPLTPDGHVNVSPKGIFEGSFNIVNPNRVWYEDLSGSGKWAINSTAQFLLNRLCTNNGYRCGDDRSLAGERAHNSDAHRIPRTPSDLSFVWER